jgi:rhamnogalacturonyl hydrolase YesR
MLICMFAAITACIVGLTSSQKPIACHDSGDAGGKSRVLVVAGLDGSGEADRLVRGELARFKNKRYAVSAIPLANPEKAALEFPPAGEAYAKNPESHHLWRWIGVRAPDLVIIAGVDAAGLGKALDRAAVAGVGEIPSIQVDLKPGFLAQALRPFEGQRSPARAEMERRLARPPEEVARQLAATYGHDLSEVVYIPAFAVIGRLRMGELADVERIVKPYVDGRKNSLEKATGSHFSGHLLFAELAERTKNPKYTELARAAADYAFDERGQAREAMPMHSEMSDSVFMGCPILAAAGKLTGETKYYDMAVKHLRFMQELVLRKDGLYRHSPLDEAAWGRGNAFPALGLMLTLGYLPRDHAGYPFALASFRKHMETLANYQDSTGMWRQVVDVPGSYAELSATCIIGASMLRGIRNGWLPASKFQPVVNRAWAAAKARIASDGRLVDVCTGTGKQPNLKAYLDRTAILGTDPRGGAMALLFATEMANLK